MLGAVFRRSVTVLAVLPLIASAAHAQYVQLNITNAFNVDSWCGPFEYQQIRYELNINATAQDLQEWRGNTGEPVDGWPLPCSVDSTIQTPG